MSLPLGSGSRSALTSSKGLVQLDALAKLLKQPLVNGSLQLDGLQLKHCPAIDKGHLHSSFPGRHLQHSSGRACIEHQLKDEAIPSLAAALD